MNKNYFIELGGFDCQFHYQDKAIHDLIFRAQFNGSRIFHSPIHVCIAEWSPGEQRRSSAQFIMLKFGHDEPIFKTLYSNPFILEEREVDYDNWKQAPEVWDKRFSRKIIPTTYEELCEIEGYKF